MKAKILRALTTAVLTCVPAAACLHAQEGTLTDEAYNHAASSGYTDASSLSVSSTDLPKGLTPLTTNYVGTYEATGGNLGVLTDGTTVGPDAATRPTNAAFDLNGNWYAEYALPASAAGFTISSVVVTTGHQDNRVDQNYDILVSTDGTSFVPLSNGTTQTLGNAVGAFV